MVIEYLKEYLKQFATLIFVYLLVPFTCFIPAIVINEVLGEDSGYFFLAMFLGVAGGFLSLCALSRVDRGC